MNLAKAVGPLHGPAVYDMRLFALYALRFHDLPKALCTNGERHSFQADLKTTSDSSCGHQTIRQ